MSRPLGRHLLVSLVAVCLIASGLIVLPSEVKPASGAAPATPKATLISQGPTGEPANASSQPPVISRDGRYVAFASFASNLVEGDTNDAPDVFLHDRATGTTKRIFTNAYMRLSLESLADNANGWEPAGSLVVPTISDDGRFVAALACPGETPINWEDVPPPGLSGINLYDTQTEETKRIAAFAWGRLVQDFQRYGDQWHRVSVHAEEATGRAYRGGTSIEEVFERGADRLIRHRILGPSGEVLHETFRKYAKFGAP